MYFKKLFINNINKIEILKIKSPNLLYIVSSNFLINFVVLTPSLFSWILITSSPYGEISKEIPVFATLTKGNPSSTALIFVNAKC